MEPPKIQSPLLSVSSRYHFFRFFFQVPLWFLEQMPPRCAAWLAGLCLVGTAGAFVQPALPRRSTAVALRMTQAPPPAKPGFVSPRAKLRALEVNKKNWEIDVSGFGSGGTPDDAAAPTSPKNSMVGFRAGDPDLLVAMAKDEAGVATVQQEMKRESA